MGSINMRHVNICNYHSNFHQISKNKPEMKTGEIGNFTKIYVYTQKNRFLNPFKLKVI